MPHPFTDDATSVRTLSPIRVLAKRDGAEQTTKRAKARDSCGHHRPAEAGNADDHRGASAARNVPAVTRGVPSDGSPSATADVIPTKTISRPSRSRRGEPDTPCVASQPVWNTRPVAGARLGHLTSDSRNPRFLANRGCTAIGWIVSGQLIRTTPNPRRWLRSGRRCREGRRPQF